MENLSSYIVTEPIVIYDKEKARETALSFREIPKDSFPVPSWTIVTLFSFQFETVSYGSRHYQGW